MGNSSKLSRRFCIALVSLTNLSAILFFTGVLPAQQPLSLPLDPTRSLPFETLSSRTPLREQYLWTAGDITAQRPDREHFPWNRPDLRTAPHLFRAHFQVISVPHAATLYIVGPREAHVFLNGHSVADLNFNLDAPIGLHVFHVDVTLALHKGDNLLAIVAVRGRGIVSGGGPLATQQLTYGEVLAAALIPAAFGAEAPRLLISDGSWRSVSASRLPEHWTEVGFDDSAWKPVASLGPVESNVDFFQWSADAGMYSWPGYRGLSPHLRTVSLLGRPTHVFSGSDSISNIQSIGHRNPNALFTIIRSKPGVATEEEAPSLLLDLGHEVSGRLLVESASPSTSLLSIAYGESEIEALATGISSGQQGGNYLGTNLLEVPPNGVARGPKSGFRYVRIRFLGGSKRMAFKSIRVEGIYYPVTYSGSFSSSDPLLNQIWETGAYTAHLCMQDGIWDAVKRDRGRWVGDLDIEGRVILDAFGDGALIEQTLHDLVPPDATHVNGIPSYSALWVTSLASLYQQTGDIAFLRSEKAALLQILSAMDRSLDNNSHLESHTKNWLFVDWAPGLYAFTPEARLGTELQYIRGYRAATSLFEALGDTRNADRSRASASRALKAAQTRRDGDGPTYGRTWQLNTLGTLLEQPEAADIIWSKVLSKVKQDSATDQVISPYFNAYLLDAMATTGHRREALDWLRTYWGGMLAEGATSFWESYDLRWPKDNPHLSLQADGTSGYFVSLAHGWSSGPTAWLTENVLGVTPASPGYDTVRIHPALLGLEYVSGTVPTPHGVVRVHLDRHKLTLDLPSGISHADVSFSPPTPGGRIYLDGVAVSPGNAGSITIVTPGRHTLESR